MKTDKIRKPTIIHIRKNNVQMNNMMVAPGFELYIEADAIHQDKFYKSLTISGKDAGINQFYVQLYKLPYNEQYFQVLKRDTNTFVDWIDKHQRIKDSLFQLIQTNEDPAVETLKRYTKWNIKFNNLALLIEYISGNQDFSDASAKNCLKKKSQGFLDSLQNMMYYPSLEYRQCLLQYVRWQIRKSILLDSTRQDNPLYPLRFVSVNYPGRLRDYLMMHQMIYYFYSSHTKSNFMQRVDEITPYLGMVEDQEFFNKINTIITRKGKEIIDFEEGLEAPAFTLPDSNYLQISLEQFGGQAVLIDLWGSWCHWCRVETPYWNQLVEAYDGRDIQFVGIAVKDHYPGWKKALIKDRPLGIQLWDEEGFIGKHYSYGSFPQYILLDKDLKILNSNAPKPSEADKLRQEIDDLLTN